MSSSYTFYQGATIRLTTADYPFMLLNDARRADYQKVVDYLKSDAAQLWLARQTLRRPIKPEVAAQVADLLMNKVAPDGLAVVMEADHFCMHWRGVKDVDARMMKSVMRGYRPRILIAKVAFLR